MATAVELIYAGPVARVRLQGERGIQLLSAETRAMLRSVVEELDARQGLRVVVFEAVGRTFIAGAVIQELAALNRRTAFEIAREGQTLMQRIAELRPVTIAAIHGACAGGGCELSLACDLRMAAVSTRIGLPETSLGLIPGWGGTARAVRLFGPAVASRMILAGELLDSATALRLGVVDSVTPDEDFPVAVDDRIATLLSRGPFALSAAKTLINAFAGPFVEEQLLREAEAFATCYDTSDPAIGTAAFLGKYPPEWETLD